MQEDKINWISRISFYVTYLQVNVSCFCLCSKFFGSVATSTLSVGVNLPAHLVIVKATHTYIMGMAHECSDLQLLQMMGRAGRPQVRILTIGQPILSFGTHFPCCLLSHTLDIWSLP